MPLQSRLFAGDRKLEAAAVSHPAHIMQGAIGEHVRKIQIALIQLDGATIAADGKFGPATAAAVLAFKQKRDIINRSYQSQADNVVGKMTMAALDREMVEAENAMKIETDSSYCRFGKPRLPGLSVFR
jgi:peptidoglycan hydrolase-like protein with peptidoglycan-binding domain